ncbi:MAG: Asp23/Gls24 family envelope stress response protein [Tepidanaerobacteraceae bacterium]|nr:Asp23/Gls24 family envelope stress response protein [Thermoanaerobacterales bacterium]
MRTLALIGKSGTGKSHRAQIIAKENDASFIIDDGLLIHGSRVLAGYSAKRETTRLGAIRRAIFQDPSHADEVKKKISEMNVDSILILGTSTSMINAICEALSLPMPASIVRIEDVSSEREINTARMIRKGAGKHVIPVPTLELKKDFSGYFLDPLRIFRERKGKQSELLEEKSVVRPTFSYLGKYTINDSTIRQIALYSAQQLQGIGPGGRVYIENYSSGIIIKMELTVEYGLQLQPILQKAQEKVAQMIEHMTSLNVLKVNVLAKNFYFKERP